VRAAKIDTSYTTNFVRWAFERDTEHAFFGDGSRQFPRGWSEVIKYPVDSLSVGIPYELSFWNYLDKSRFGGPKCYFRLLGPDGKRLEEQYQWINEVFEFQRGWLRASFVFTIPEAASHVELVTEYNFPYWLDEVQIRPLDEDARFSEGGQMLYNNFRLN
ncbi:MAG: hypothetical protein AAFZ52_18480, partial [Bacteroidota bacterium]